MRRRDLLILGGASALGWRAARAAADIPRVAFVAVGFGADMAAFDALRDDLGRLGEIEGKTYLPDPHVANDPAAVQRLAAETVATHPAIIVTINSTAVPELMKLTESIPIVVAFSGDPVALGFSRSVGRPSRNITGVLTLQEELIVKKLELLGQLVKPLRRVGVMHQVGSPGADLTFATTMKNPNPAGPVLVSLPIAAAAEVAHVLDRSEAQGLDGLVVLGSPIIVTERAALIAAEIAKRLPAIHDFLFEVQDGALAAYGSDPAANFARAAEYTARLLHGAKVAELPFDAPNAIRLSLNLKTAKRIGLTIPPSLLAIANDVIE